MSELQQALDARDLTGIRALTKNWTGPAVADSISAMSGIEQAVVMRVLPRNVVASAFEFFDRATQNRFLKALGQQEVADILNHMAPDDRTEFLEESPAAVTKQLLEVLSPPEREVALSLLGYPKKSSNRFNNWNSGRMSPEDTIYIV